MPIWIANFDIWKFTRENKFNVLWLIILQFSRIFHKKPMLLLIILQSVGMTDFYWKFRPNFSLTVGPLTDLLQKRVKFHWGKNSYESFCKNIFSWVVFFTPDFSKQFKFTVDASDVGISAALFQEHNDNVDICVSFIKETYKISKQLITWRYSVFFVVSFTTIWCLHGIYSSYF